jgi:hypothetical protein
MPGARPRARAEEETLVLDPKDVSRALSVTTDDRRRSKRRGPVEPRWLTVGLALAAGLVLGACAIPFGNGAEPSNRPPEETRRDRNRLYLEEQERMERSRMFDRVGPSDR